MSITSIDIPLLLFHFSLYASKYQNWFFSPHRCISKNDRKNLKNVIIIHFFRSKTNKTVFQLMKYFTYRHFRNQNLHYKCKINFGYFPVFSDAKF